MKGEEREAFVEVALSIPLSKNLHYRVPAHLSSRVSLGKRVLVPLGKREVTGFVVGVVLQPGVSETKEIVDVLDDQPLFTSRHLSFYQWVSEYYFSSLGEVIKAALPGNLNVRSTSLISLTEEGKRYLSSKDDTLPITLLTTIDSREGITVGVLRKAYRGGGLDALLNRLERRGLITREHKRARGSVKVKREKWITLREEGYQLLQSPERMHSLEVKTHRQALLLNFLGRRGGVCLRELKKEFSGCEGALKKLEERALINLELKEIYRDPLRSEECLPEQIPQLNAAQREAMRKIGQGITSRKYAPFLLYGVTGSGKTEIYLRAIEEVLAQGREALVLVPEISLTPQIVNRFRARFGDSIVLLHSRLSPGERFDGWRRIRQGKVGIAIGARSAVFAPFSHLGIIVVDEEHDTSYKQEEKLRYHARDLALVRAKSEDAVVILGSATPSLESYHNSTVGKLTLLRLNERVEGKPLPVIEIVDMRGEHLHHKEKRRELSHRLEEALRERLHHHQHSLLFLNRRGFAPCVMCGECGYVFGCPNCSVSLIHHQREKALQCHYCGYTAVVPSCCPQCRGMRIQLLGWGTERLEEEVKTLFPEAQVERMDRDTTTGKGGHKKVLKRFVESKGGILIGTQMITKGHDIPQVTLVGVVSADLSLHFPDFRSSERTFQQLTQVAGRAGRGDIPGEVIIQTFHPHHYSIRASQQHAFSQFYEEEITFRRELNYPPFGRLLNFKMEGNSKKKTAAFAEGLGAIARSLWDGKNSYREHIQILGPAASPWERMKGKFRYQMVLKGSTLTTLRSFATQLLHQIPTLLKGEGVKFYVDVDPVSLL